MKAYLRPVDRTQRGGGVESGSWFLAKAKHQADNYWESKLLAPPSFHSPLTPALPPPLHPVLHTLLLHKGQQRQLQI